MARRLRFRSHRLRRVRQAITLALALAEPGHQPLLLALHVPPPQRLGRAADGLGNLLAFHPGEHQRQCTRVLGRREPAAPRRHTLTLAATRIGLRDTVTFTRRMRSDHERLLAGTAGPWRPPLRRPGGAE